jgi:hypothetical protein
MALVAVAAVTVFQPSQARGLVARLGSVFVELAAVQVFEGTLSGIKPGS